MKISQVGGDLVIRLPRLDDPIALGESIHLTQPVFNETVLRTDGTPTLYRGQQVKLTLRLYIDNPAGDFPMRSETQGLPLGTSPCGAKRKACRWRA